MHSMINNGVGFLVFHVLLEFPLRYSKYFIINEQSLTNETHSHWPLNFFIGHYIIPMDSNSSSFLLNSSNFHSVFYQDKHDDGIIDLGLSLGTVQHDAYHSSTNCMSSSPLFILSIFQFVFLFELNFDISLL